MALCVVLALAFVIEEVPFEDVGSATGGVERVYTGGILASVYTDLGQGAIMIVAAVFVCFAALNAVDGGLTGIVTTLMEDDPESGAGLCQAYQLILMSEVALPPRAITFSVGELIRTM